MGGKKKGIKEEIAQLLEEDGAAWTLGELSNWLKVSDAGCSRALERLYTENLVTKVRVREGDPPVYVHRYTWVGKRENPRIVC